MARLSVLSSRTPVPVASQRRIGRSRSAARGLLGLVAGATVLAAATNADAYAVKRTSHGDLVHWEERIVDYTIDPSVDANVPNGTEATLSSMDSWSGTVGAPDLKTIPVDANSPTKPGFDPKNGVFYINGGYAPAGRALAITVLTYDNASGRILDADVIVNGSYSFEVLRAPEELLKQRETGTHPSAATDGLGHEEETIRLESVYDLHHVVAHELGHSLGMNDEMGRKDALMYRYSAPNDATMREPASDDIAGLAELYSTNLEGAGNGCGSATVAPKAPSRPASHAAMFATLGLLAFLILRARSDRRARVGFVFAAAAAAVAFMPTLSGKSGPGVARASESTMTVGHARAKVLGITTTNDLASGLFKTQYKLATTACHASICPKAGHGQAWGGTIGNITQEVGGQYAPAAGDEVDVSFTTLPPSALTTLSRPLAARPTLDADTAVRVVTRAIARDL